MITLNESLGGKEEIGNSVFSEYLELASVTRYEKLKNIKNLRISRIKFLYQRDKYLVAMQFMFQEADKIEIENDISSMILTDPKLLGPINYSLAETDEIELCFGKREEIYLIEGVMKDNAIVNMRINTTYGQFVEFGSTERESNFRWEYYNNQKIFNGFLVGWDDKKINYLSCLAIEKDEVIEAPALPAPKDITEDFEFINTNPIYKSEMFGELTPCTSIEDDLVKNELLNDIRAGLIYLSMVYISYDGKIITRIDTEYTNSQSGRKYPNKHISDSYKENNEWAAIDISNGDYVKEFGVCVYKNKYINRIFLKTKSRKEITIKGSDSSKTM